MKTQYTIRCTSLNYIPRRDDNEGFCSDNHLGYDAIYFCDKSTDISEKILLLPSGLNSMKSKKPVEAGGKPVCVITNSPVIRLAG
jgi:hypothetical protein